MPRATVSRPSDVMVAPLLPLQRQQRGNHDVAREPRRRAVPKGRRWPCPPCPPRSTPHPAQVTSSRPAEQDRCQPGCDDPLNPPYEYMAPASRTPGSTASTTSSHFASRISRTGSQANAYGSPQSRLKSAAGSWVGLEAKAEPAARRASQRTVTGFQVRPSLQVSQIWLREGLAWRTNASLLLITVAIRPSPMSARLRLGLVCQPRPPPWM
jgi:hypothetical protein